MEHLVGGAKAGDGLGNLVDGFLERDRLAEQRAHGMVGPTIAGPNAAMAGATMMGEDAAQLGMFAAPPVAPGLDVEDFLAASQGYAAEDAAFAQMDAPPIAQAQHAMAGPSVDDFAAFQQAQGPSGEESIAFQQAQGPSAADFAAFQATQGPSATVEAFQAAQGPSVADFQAFQQSRQGPSVADFEAFQRQAGATGRRAEVAAAHEKCLLRADAVPSWSQPGKHWLAKTLAKGDAGAAEMTKVFAHDMGGSLGWSESSEEFKQAVLEALLSTDEFKARLLAGAAAAGIGPSASEEARSFSAAHVAQAHEKCMVYADAVSTASVQDLSRPQRHWLASNLAKWDDAGAAEITKVYGHDIGGNMGWSDSSEEFKQAVQEALLSTDEFKARLLAGAAAAGFGPSASEEVGSFCHPHVAQAHKMCLLCADGVQNLSRPQRHWLASNLAKWDDAGAAEITKVYGHDIGGNMGWSDSSEEFKQAVQEALLSTDEFKARLLAGAAAAGFGPSASEEYTVGSARMTSLKHEERTVGSARQKCFAAVDVIPTHWPVGARGYLARTLEKGDAGVEDMTKVFAHDMGGKLGWSDSSEEFKQEVLEALLSTDEFKARLLAGAAAAGIGPLASEAARSQFQAELEEYEDETSLTHEERTVDSARQKCLTVADLIPTHWPVGARGYLARTLETGDAGVEDMTKVFVYDTAGKLGWKDSSEEFKQALLKVLLSTDEFKARLLAGAAAAGIGPSASEAARSQFQAELEEYEDETLRLGGKPDHLKRDLTKQVKSFVTEVQAFRKDWVDNGLTVPGIAAMTATEALMRLEKFDSAFAETRRKADTYSSREALLGMPRTEYTELDLTEKELHVAKRLLRGLGHTL